MKKTVIIIGAGLAGLSAALTLTKEGQKVLLVSSQPSERAQSVMAEGGINAAMDTKGEHDTVRTHAAETIRSAAGVASERAAEEMTAAAPEIVRWLISLGVAFNRQPDGQVDLRNFGGQKNKRTVFAQNNTGKQVMTALIDAVRREEVRGTVERYSGHEFVRLLGEERCTGCVVRDWRSGEEIELRGDAVIMATGGLHGLFNQTTGSMFNTGHAAAVLFAQGVEMSNLEMIQFHPTTVDIRVKRMLVSEAARGEGGRLYAMHDGKRCYFMEEKYPELGNLMPRDVTSREIYRESRTGKVWLDMTEFPAEKWEKKLSEMRKDLIFYLNVDPAKQPVEIGPGIHYFMGGIRVDDGHRTNIGGLYAAGECSAQYHGANRLGGNSLLGAIYGGRRAAQSVLKDEQPVCVGRLHDAPSTPPVNDAAHAIMQEAMGVVRTESELQAADGALKRFDDPEGLLCRAIVESGMARKESRGAHFRDDYPEKDPKYEKASVALWDGNAIRISFESVREEGEAK